MAKKTLSTKTEKRRENALETAPAPMGTVLGVSNMEKAIKFYESLGFKLDTALPGSDGELTLAILTFGPSMMLLGRLDELHYEDTDRARKIRKGPHGLGVTLTLLVPDLEKVYRAVKKAGLEILLEPVDEFYGDRVFMFLDPDGYEWKISQMIKQVDPEEVAEIVASS
ncbi:MAG TPA: VOC family protein [Anaerolineales bacterium]|nr:VOC family protein [Anaerolineales bacterium]